MPSLKRNVSKAPDRTGFEVYDGPTPREGLYEGVLKSCTLKRAKSGNLMYRVLVELDDKTTEYKATTIGFPAFGNLVLLDSDAAQAREKKFYRAIGGEAAVRGDANVVYDNEADVDSQAGAKVTKIAGKNPIGTRVKVALKHNEYNGSTQAQVDDISPAGKPTTPVVADDEPVDDDYVAPDEDEAEDTPEDGVEEGSEEDRVAELKAAGIAEVRKLAREHGVDTTGLKKPELIDAIIAAEFGEDEAEPEEAEEEEEDEAEEEAAEEADPLLEMDRAALRALLKELDSTATTKKSESDDDIRTRIRDLQTADDTDADEEEDDEDEEEGF